MADVGRVPPPILPQLKYEDPAAALAWLARVFDFTETFRMAGPDGTVYVAGLSSPAGGRVLISGMSDLETLRSRVPEMRPLVDAGWPNRTYSITVVLDEVDGHHTRAAAEGATIVEPPTDRPWGMREYEALDLEGRQWTFGQILRTVELEDWGATPS